MNFRYLYIALVIAFAYMLFLSWGQDSERKKELVEAAFIERIEVATDNPPDESAGFIEIQNEKILVNQPFYWKSLGGSFKRTHLFE